jgi:hypothetical protein
MIKSQSRRDLSRDLRVIRTVCEGITKEEAMLYDLSEDSYLIIGMNIKI